MVLMTTFDDFVIRTRRAAFIRFGSIGLRYLVIRIKALDTYFQTLVCYKL